MEESEIRRLLGTTIYHRAERYVDQGRVYDFTEMENEDGSRYLSAEVKGSKTLYMAEAWLRKNGSFISASCTCPYNQNGEGELCKHIGALLLEDNFWNVQNPAPATSVEPTEIEGVMWGSEYAEKLRAETGENAQNPSRSGNYASSLDMLFGSKWSNRPKEPESDDEARFLLRWYQEDDHARQERQPVKAAELQPGSVHLEPELTLDMAWHGRLPELRLHVSNGGRAYIVKDIGQLLRDIAEENAVSYGKKLAFVHRMEVFDEPSQKLLAIMRRQQGIMRYVEEMQSSYYRLSASGGVTRKGAVLLAGDVFEEMFDLYYREGMLSGYFLHKGMPQAELNVEKKPGGAELLITPEMSWFESSVHAYIFSQDSIWQTEKAVFTRLSGALLHINKRAHFFTKKDMAVFCSYVLPEFEGKLRLNDPERLLLDQLPMEPVVQYYLDAPGEQGIAAHVEFLYGEDRVTPFDPPPLSLLRDTRTERRAEQVLRRYLHEGLFDLRPGVYETRTEEEIYTFLEEGIPALTEAGEVYLSDAFRRLQVPAPKITVGVSVQGSVLDLDIDTGEFPVEELRALLDSLHRKKRYHRLRDGRLMRLDSSMEILDELHETLTLSGTGLDAAHTQLPLYRAPSLERALAGQSGIRFNRDDAFRRISRSFHSVQDSEYTVPESLNGVLRKYQRDGYRWLRTLDSYGMGGILADDMGLGKTLQVLAYLLAVKESGRHGPSLIVCPASLVLNWEEECRKFTPQLRCLPVDGDAARRAELADRFGEYDLVVTSYDLLRRDIELYADKPFYACIIDEAQAIKNHTTQKHRAVCRVQSEVRFALTGTPVENRLSELWSIFSFLMPGYLYPYKVFSERLEKPIVLDGNEAASRRLNQLTGPFLLRRMKKDVLKELPPKIEKVTHIQMDEEQRRLYLAAVLDAKEKLRAAQPEDRVAVFAVLMRLRQICCDPRLIADNWEGSSAKLEACAELVSEAVESGHRILIFSQFTSMLSLLEKRLDEMEISHFTLQGATSKPMRAELVRRFNAGEASVFLISLRAGGTGLNLTAADVVIHYDPWWNIAAQNQATDRAYRIGQQNTVQVYKLIAQDTIEDKILELQENKRTLAETVTGTADGAILSMKPEELLALLEG